MSWSGYPCHLCNSFVKLLKTNQQINKANKEEGKGKIIWLKFP